MHFQNMRKGVVLYLKQLQFFRVFEKTIVFTQSFQGLIPVSFILGFYIDYVFSRFWRLFMTIPWVLKFAISITGHLPGDSDRPRMMRRTCFRYMMGSLIMTCTRLNLIAKKRFPTPEFFVTAGIFTEDEVTMIMNVAPTHMQPFLPIVWTTSLITRAQKEGLITNHHALVSIIDEVNNFRQGLLDMFMMDFVCIPLVYTQVVTLAVYIYFVASLIGRQFVINSSPYADQVNTRDLYFPFFTILEFIVYMGLLKVAETLVNPMGENDEDIDINEVIDFNWKAGWCIVDGMKTSVPSIVRDIHWQQSVIELPHTEESRRLAARPFRGSVYDINLPFNQDLIGSGLSLSRLFRSQDFDGGGMRKFSRQSTVIQPTRMLSAESSLPIVETDNRKKVNNEECSPGETGALIATPTTTITTPHTPVTASRLLHEPIEEEDEEPAEDSDSKDNVNRREYDKCTGEVRRDHYYKH
ncbi:unnamed protein product [Trichobilharzia szidati]|nr:unnamed protein product [Trichobilharzia szidati]